MTVKEFFRKLKADQSKLVVLKCRLEMLDSNQISITRADPIKVQGGRRRKQEDKIIMTECKRKEIEREIAMLEFEVEYADHALRSIKESENFSSRILKRKYIDGHSINKIANDFNLSPSKVKKILNDTERVLLCLID